MYDWVKAFHIIAVIAWLAGMLYLQRLFVYHCTAEKGSVQSETFKTMERRLLRIIRAQPHLRRRLWEGRRLLQLLSHHAGL